MKRRENKGKRTKVKEIQGENIHPYSIMINTFLQRFWRVQFAGVSSPASRSPSLCTTGSTGIYPLYCTAYVVVVFDVTVVAFGHGLLKKFWPVW